MDVTKNKQSITETYSDEQLMAISESPWLWTWQIIRQQMQCQKNTLGNRGNTYVKRLIFICGMTRTCLREVLTVYFTGVLHVKKWIALYGTTIT